MTALIAGSTSAGALADSADPHVSDECGDADRMVQAGDVVVGTQDPERAAGYDIKSVRFEDLYDEQDRHVGVRTQLQMCGALPGPEITNSYWAVRVNIEGPCTRVLYLHDTDHDSDPMPAAQRKAFLSSQCSRPSETLPGWTEGYVEWTAELETHEYAVAGDTITWTLTPDLLPGGRTDFVTEGTVWSSQGASARDGRRLTETYNGQVVEFGASGPGASDGAGSSAPFTVGEQGPDA